MPVLSNPKHEAFAHALASGVSATEAYVSAGYSAQGAYASAHRLLKNADVSARIAEIQSNVAERVTEKTAITKAWVLDALRENFDRAMQHEAVRDSDGALTGTYTYNGNVANKALELMGRELGMFVDRKDVTVRRSLAELTDEELDALIADASQRLGAAAPVALGSGD
jgi:phage terminase small subunit